MKKLAYIFGVGSVLFAALMLAPSAFAAVTTTAATGGGAISADSCGSSTWTTLTGPVLTETSPGSISTGTIILTAPTGFEFNTGVTVSAAVSGSPLKLTLSSGTATPTAGTITFTVTGLSTSSSAITYSNVQVNPTSGFCTTPSTGNLTLSGTAGLSGNAGALALTAGAANKLIFTTEPASVVTVNNTFSNVVVAIEDQYGNVRTDTTTVTLAGVSSGNSSNPSATTLSGTLSVAAVSGSATFSTLSYIIPDYFEIKATDGALTDAVSTAISVLPQGGGANVIGNVAPPSSTITYPASGATFAPGSSVVITGTTKASGSSLQAVYVSLDGGQTWQNASGVNGSFANWTYAWTTPASGTTTIESRAKNWLTQLGPISTVNVVIGGPVASTPIVVNVSGSNGTITLTPTPPTPSPTPSTPPSSPSNSMSPSAPSSSGLPYASPVGATEIQSNISYLEGKLVVLLQELATLLKAGQ